MDTTHHDQGDRPPDGPDRDPGPPRPTLPAEHRPSQAGAPAMPAGRLDEADAGEVCDRHGAALLSLACAILLDDEEAERIVVEVIAAACTGPVDDFVPGSLRYNLARRTYLHCMDSLAADADEPRDRLHDDGAVAAMDKLREIARQQRASVVLIMMGDHTAPDVAQLLGLTPARVVALLSSCVGELRTADRQIAQSTISPARRRRSSWASSELS